MFHGREIKASPETFVRSFSLMLCVSVCVRERECVCSRASWERCAEVAGIQCVRPHPGGAVVSWRGEWAGSWSHTSVVESNNGACRKVSWIRLANYPFYCSPQNFEWFVEEPSCFSDKGGACLWRNGPCVELWDQNICSHFCFPWLFLVIFKEHDYLSMKC